MASSEPPVAAEAWTMYQGSAGHNAVVEGSFSAEWTADIGDRTNGGLAVAGSSLYVDTFGQRVLALNLHSGAVRWTSDFDGIVMSTPVVAGGFVFIGTGRNAIGNTHLWGRAQGDRMVALDAASGEERWSFKTRGEDMPSPAYVDGVLVFANGDAHVYGLQAATGRLLWSRRLPGIATMASASSVQRDVLLSVCTDRFASGMTLRVRASDGAIVWKSPYGNCDCAPAYGANRVFVSGDEGLVQSFGFGGRGLVAALDASTGKPLWAYRSQQVGFDVTAGSAERAVAGTYDRGTYYQSIPGDDAFGAFDASTGAVRWIVRTMAPVKMSALVVRNRVFFGDGAGLLYTIDSQTGRVLQTHMFRDGFSTSPAILVGRTLLFANGRTVYATPLIHYWGARIDVVPALKMP